MLHLFGDAALKAAILAKVADADEALGVEIMFRCLPAPMKQIVKNAGLEGDVVVDKVRTVP